MARVISLIEAIGAGRLGDLGPDISFMEIAERLGPPVAMEREADGRGWTWHYGQLAISGPLDAARPVASLSLLRPAFTSGALVVIGGSPAGRFRRRPGAGLVLSLDIEGSIRAGAMLDRLAAAGIATELGWREDRETLTFALVIRAGTVRLHFAGDLDDTTRGTPPAETLAALYDGSAALTSITWTAGPDDGALQWLDAAAYRRGADASEPSQVLWWGDSGQRGHPPLSLADFLATGEFGPIGTALTRQDIGRDFGAPTTMGAHADYWGYGALYLSFAPDGAMEWVQIEYARTLTGDCEIVPTGGFAGPLILMLDGLSGTSRPSDIVRLLLARGRTCRVAVRIDQEGSGGPAFDAMVIAGRVLAAFHDPRQGGPEPAGDDPRGLATAVEARARFDEIYAYAPGFAARQIGNYTRGAVEMSGEDYLTLLGLAPRLH